MTIPTISVIVPVYNADQYLQTCLESIISQSYRNLEIILVNDGSTDRSGTICDDYALKDIRVKVLHQPNSGPSSARNSGLEVATGEWITFIDSDDYAEPDLCAYLLDLALKYDADFVQCGAFWEGRKCTRCLFLPERTHVYIKGVYEFDPKTWFFLGNGNWGKLYRRNALGMIRFDSAFTIGEDLYFNLQALAKARCIVLGADAKYHYVQTPQSLFRAAPSREKLLSCRNMLEKAREEFKNSDVLLVRVADEYYRNCLDICSKVVSFKLKNEQDICLSVRREIRARLMELLWNSAFSISEKTKFVLIGCFWPIYCVLLLCSKWTK